MQRRGLSRHSDNVIACNQVALRVLEPSSVHRHLCALHVDSNDQGTMPLIYLTQRLTKLSASPSTLPDPVGDLLVFEDVRGGKAVQVRTRVPGFVCVVIFSSSKCLHGNVYPDRGYTPQLPWLWQQLRIVPYQLSGVAAMCDQLRCGTLPSSVSGRVSMRMPCRPPAPFSPHRV